jgi:CO/xanthine dehydrogenase Mo-binding subunit
MRLGVLEPETVIDISALTGGDGHLTIQAGVTDIGQGPPTIIPQVAAGVLGLEPEAIEFQAGDSNLPFAGPAYGSSVTIGMGAAVLDGARQLVACLADMAGWPSKRSQRPTVACAAARSGSGSPNSLPEQAAPSP